MNIAFGGRHKAFAATRNWPPAAWWSRLSARPTITGWKVGYAVAPTALTAEFRKGTSSTCSGEYAGAAGHRRIHGRPRPLPWAGRFLPPKRDRFAALLAATPFELLPCHGTYFQLARYDAISDRPDREFFRWLTREVGVAVIPISAFYHNGHDDRVVRFCFAKRDETLEEAAERLRRL